MHLQKKKGEGEKDWKGESEGTAGKKETVQHFRSILKQRSCSLWTSVSILKQKAGVEADDCKILGTSAFKGSRNYIKLKEFRKDKKNTWTLLWCKTLRTRRKTVRL